MASAAWTSTASTVCGSTSKWCASTAWTTAADSPCFLHSWPEMMACEPSTSCVTALPMSCSSAARRAIFWSAPISAAIIAARCAHSSEWRSTFWPYDVR